MVTSMTKYNSLGQAFFYEPFLRQPPALQELAVCHEITLNHDLASDISLLLWKRAEAHQHDLWQASFESAHSQLSV